MRDDTGTNEIADVDAFEADEDLDRLEPENAAEIRKARSEVRAGRKSGRRIGYIASEHVRPEALDDALEHYAARLRAEGPPEGGEKGEDAHARAHFQKYVQENPDAAHPPKTTSSQELKRRTGFHW